MTTLEIYAHSNIADEVAAVGKLPDLSPSAEQDVGDCEAARLD